MMAYSRDFKAMLVLLPNILVAFRLQRNNTLILLNQLHLNGESKCCEYQRLWVNLEPRVESHAVKLRLYVENPTQVKRGTFAENFSSDGY